MGNEITGQCCQALPSHLRTAGPQFCVFQPRCADFDPDFFHNKQTNSEKLFTQPWVVHNTRTYIWSHTCALTHSCLHDEEDDDNDDDDNETIKKKGLKEPGLG